MKRNLIYIVTACILLILVAGSFYFIVKRGGQGETDILQSQLEQYERTTAGESEQEQNPAASVAASEPGTAGTQATEEETIKAEYREDGLLIVTDAYFQPVSRKPREEQTFYIKSLDEEQLFPEGYLLEASLKEIIREDCLLRLTGSYEGKQVRNYINKAMLAKGDVPIAEDVFIKEFELTGTIYSCTSLLSHCKALERANLSGAENPYGFYQFQLLFESCTALKEVLLPPDIREISMGMFMNCTALEEVELPETVEVIDTMAFYGCSSLKKLVIPDSVRVIGDRAFAGCDNLVIVASEGSAADLYAKEQGITVERSE